ncbi:hypothetical protein EVAR_25270_1 [Eumeta japonica]|uniref:Uncharacterized protein n=1 Tax=Eumeta variegata TaxID=151549 RepID=A0A4C1VMT3_EUMVA|nr:hypothetical protein EVAR_25270_1 [Eumeta japonica]
MFYPILKRQKSELEGRPSGSAGGRGRRLRAYGDRQSTRTNTLEGTKLGSGGAPVLRSTAVLRSPERRTWSVTLTAPAGRR